MAMEKYLVNYIINKTLDASIVSSMLLKYNKKKELIETKSIINTYYNNPFDLEYGFKFAILKYVENNNEEYRKRDYAIIMLFLNCGLRLSELSSIDIDKIKDNDTLSIIGKGNKERTIFLNDACISAIKDYLTVRPKNSVDKKAMFISKRKNRMSNRAIQHMIDRYLEKTGLDTSIYSTHKLRHTAATLMYKYGNVDIRALQEILGHESVSTTQIYTHIDNERLRDAVKSNPLSSRTNKKS